MNNCIQALLYRNFFLLKTIIIFGFAMICWCLLNLNFADPTGFVKISPDMIFGCYIFIIILQYQTLVTHSMVDDRSGKFRSLYRIMGLNNNSYLIGQFLSFFFLMFTSVSIFYGVFYIDKKLLIHFKSENNEEISDILKIGIQFLLIIIQGITFSMLLSYLFTNPSIGRDISFLLNFCAFAFGIYAYSYDYIKYSQYILPYQTFCKYLISSIKNEFLGDEEQETFLKRVIIQLQQSFITGILIYYIDNVMPREDDNQRPWNFFITDFKKWVKSRQKKEIIQIIQNDFENNQINQGVMEVVNLNKNFGDVQVLKNLNFTFQKGNLYTLLGHNGAGKSTFINIITGLYQPTSGQILWEGKDFREIKKNSDFFEKVDIGICPSFESQWEHLTVYQHLKILAYIKNVKNIPYKIEEILQLFNLTEYRDFKSKALSGGNRRKLTLALSVIGNPKILFLDEPTSSVDPKSRKDIWDILEKLKQSKDMITILTTHHLEEAELLSDQISVLQFGKIIVQGTVNDIIREFGVGYQIELFSTNEAQIEFTQILEKLGKKFQYETEIHKRKMLINLSLQNQHQLEDLVGALEQNLPSGINFFVNSNTLEKAYLDIDLQQHQEMNIDMNFDKSIIENMYTHYELNLFQKILLIAKNKIIFLGSNILELLKFILCSSFSLIALILLLEVDDFVGGYLGSYIYYFIYFQVVIEISSSQFPAYNVVYEKENDIKLLLHSQRITSIQYYLGKILADLFLNTITFSIIYIGFVQIAKKQIQEDPDLFENFMELFYIIFFWKFSFQNLSYLMVMNFSDKRTFLKFFPFLYSGYIGVIALLKYLTNIQQFDYFSDLMQLMQIALGTQTINYKIIFTIQSLLFISLVILIEEYQLKFNYIVQNLKSPSFSFRQFGFTKNTSNQFLQIKNNILEEEQNVIQDDSFKLKVLNLYKNYRFGWFWKQQKIAVRNISFGIHPKSSLGLVGPNGAGKTTTFNMILNKIMKTGGSIKIKNMLIKENYTSFLKNNIFFKFRFGISFQGNTLWEDLTVQQNLEFYSELNKVNKRGVDKLIQFFELNFYLKKKVSQLSSGNKRKVCIIISLMTDPQIILYDEATCGVDIVIRQKLQKIFTFIKNKNNAVCIFTTHFLKDIEIFCDKLGLIKQGQFVCIDYLQNIQKNLGGYNIKIEDLKLSPESIIEILKQEGKAEIGKKYQLGGRVQQQFFLFFPEKISTVISYLNTLKKSNKCKDFIINQLSVEDIYLSLVNEEQLIKI